MKKLQQEKESEEKHQLEWKKKCDNLTNQLIEGKVMQEKEF